VQQKGAVALNSTLTMLLPKSGSALQDLQESTQENGTQHGATSGEAVA
jgi:hypothetical protein